MTGDGPKDVNPENVNIAEFSSCRARAESEGSELCLGHDCSLPGDKSMFHMSSCGCDDWSALGHGRYLNGWELLFIVPFEPIVGLMKSG